MDKYNAFIAIHTALMMQRFSSAILKKIFVDTSYFMLQLSLKNKNIIHKTENKRMQLQV